jgi:hypothetical protein
MKSVSNQQIATQNSWKIRKFLAEKHRGNKHKVKQEYESMNAEQRAQLLADINNGQASRDSQNGSAPVVSAIQAGTQLMSPSDYITHAGQMRDELKREIDEKQKLHDLYDKIASVPHKQS